MASAAIERERSVLAVRPSLLVSIHDVSPLTWAQSKRAVELVVSCGVPLGSLTLLVIPEHEGRFRLTAHPAFIEWLKGLSRNGVTLVAHGLTHEMTGSLRSPLQFAWAYIFAGGQAEFYNLSAAQARERLARVRALFQAVGLDEALRGFVPPAWLLSFEARTELDRLNIAFSEGLGGIELGARRLAARLIGWGARSVLESLLTALHAELQCLRSPSDTRLAVHPRDMTSRLCTRSIQRCLHRLCARTEPLNYAGYLACIAARTPSPAAASSTAGDAVTR